MREETSRMIRNVREMRHFSLQRPLPTNPSFTTYLQTNNHTCLVRVPSPRPQHPNGVKIPYLLGKSRSAHGGLVSFGDSSQALHHSETQISPNRTARSARAVRVRVNTHG